MPMWRDGIWMVPVSGMVRNAKAAMGRLPLGSGRKWKTYPAAAFYADFISALLHGNNYQQPVFPVNRVKMVTKQFQKHLFLLTE